MSAPRRSRVTVRVTAATRAAAGVKAMERVGYGLWFTRAVPDNRRFVEAGVATEWTVTVEIIPGYEGRVDVRSPEQQRIDALLGK